MDPRQERYWDGWQWSRNTRANESAAGSARGPVQPVPVDQHPGHQPGPQNQGLYQQGQYQQGPYGQGQYQQGPDGQAPYQQGPYQQGQYEQGQHEQGSYGQAPYQQAPFQPGGYPQQTGGYPQQLPPGYPVAYGGQPGPLTADGVPLAGWWWRALAAVIDNIVTSVIAAAIAIPLLWDSIQRAFVLAQEAASRGTTPNPLDTNAFFSAGDLALLTLTSVLVTLGWQLGFLRWKGATPGKLATGLRVVPVDRGRSTERLGWGSIVLRALVWVAPIASGWLFLVRLVDILLPLWHPKRQALHDLAAKTQVVKVR